MAASTIYNLENYIKYLKKKSNNLKKNNKRLSQDNIGNKTLLIFSNSTWKESDSLSAISKPLTDSPSPDVALPRPLKDSPSLDVVLPSKCMSFSSFSTVSAESSKPDISLPQVPEWSITLKMENYFSSKQKSKAKKRSLQSNFIKKE